MVPEVFYTVCLGTSQPPQAIKDLFTFQPAILHGYCRRQVVRADYPGIIEQPGASVAGCYVSGLTDANIVKLDTFEGSEYRRDSVTVKILKKSKETGEVVEAEEKIANVYVFLYAEDLNEEEWDIETFRRDKLRAWTRNEHIFEGGFIPYAEEIIMPRQV
jgi:hypothetical protein